MKVAPRSRANTRDTPRDALRPTPLKAGVRSDGVLGLRSNRPRQEKLSQISTPLGNGQSPGGQRPPGWEH